MDSFKRLRKEKQKHKKQFGLRGENLPALVAIDKESIANKQLYKNLTEACGAVGLIVACANTSAERARIFGAADVAIVFDQKARESAVENGCIPVAPTMKENDTRDYDPVSQKGNGFYFKKNTVWEIFASLIRALETYRFPYDWENVLREVVDEQLL